MVVLFLFFLYFLFLFFFFFFFFFSARRAAAFSETGPNRVSSRRGQFSFRNTSRGGFPHPEVGPTPSGTMESAEVRASSDAGFRAKDWSSRRYCGVRCRRFVKPWSDTCSPPVGIGGNPDSGVGLVIPGGRAFPIPGGPIGLAIRYGISIDSLFARCCCCCCCFIICGRFDLGGDRFSEPERGGGGPRPPIIPAEGPHHHPRQGSLSFHHRFAWRWPSLGGPS